MTILLALVAFFVIVLLYMWLVEPRRVTLRHEVVSVNPNQLQHPVKILFLSDFHLGLGVLSSTVRAKMMAAQRAHVEHKFDLLFLGGDYLDRSIKYLPELELMLAELKKLGIPTYGVWGNHDHQHFTTEEQAQLEVVLKKGGVHLLRNEAELVKVGKEEFVLVGMDDLMRSSDYGVHRKRHARSAIYQERAEKMDWYHPHDRFNRDHLRIMLAHNPDTAHMQGATRPDIVLSGHTHGGQFLPLRWFEKAMYFVNAVPPGSYLAWAGRKLIMGTTLIVSRGIGESTLPLRLGVAPEMVAITLEQANVPRDLIIGLSGKPRSGKDTAARIIQATMPGIKVVGFSDAIRDEFDIQYGTNTRLSEKEKDKHRATMQEFGAGKVRQDVNYWIKRVLGHKPPMLITGVRRIPEADAIKEAGGKLIRVEVSDKTFRERLGEELYEANKNHDNETQLDNYGKWDYVIENNGTLEEFEHKVLELLRSLK